jgi:hypothetical protein
MNYLKSYRVVWIIQALKVTVFLLTNGHQSLFIFFSETIHSYLFEKMYICLIVGIFVKELKRAYRARFVHATMPC